MQQQAYGAPHCALVLGGGGPLGMAWEAGMLQGWADSHGGADPFAPFLAGRIVGTSAGSLVGTHLAAHGSIANLATRQSGSMEAAGLKRPRMIRFLAAYFKARLLTRSVDEFRRSLGKSARRTALPGEAAFVAMLAGSYAPAETWPKDRDLRITAVDAETGEFHAWAAGAGVPLPHAVAASCAMPCVFPLVHLRDGAYSGRIYMDGGIGSSTNVTVAAGCARVLVLDPLGRVAGNRSPLEAECRSLEAQGSRTLAFVPDQAVANTIGRNFLDFRRYAQVAALSRAQGRATGESMWTFLNDASRPHGAGKVD